MKKALNLLAVLIGLPALGISLFITHELLEAVHADRLMWFLFWAYVPAVLITSVISKVASSSAE